MDDSDGFTPKLARRAILSQTRATPQTQRRVTFADASAPMHTPLAPTLLSNNKNDDNAVDGDDDPLSDSPAPGIADLLDRTQASADETSAVDGESTVSIFPFASSASDASTCHLLISINIGFAACGLSTRTQDRRCCLLV